MKLRLEVAIGTTVGRRAEIRRAIHILRLIERAMREEDEEREAEGVMVD